MSDTKSMTKVGIGRRGLQPQNLDELWRCASAISKSSYGAKESPEDVFVALQAGMELGFSMVQARSAVYSVKGRPAIMGEAARALVFDSGVLKKGTSIRSWFLDENGKEIQPHMLPINPDDWDNGIVCITEAHREGQKEAITRSFSVTEAKRMGLWNKQGKYGPSAWATAPAEMMEARSWGKLVRKLFPDVVRGMYTVEEARDFGHDYRADHAKPVEAERVDPEPDKLLASLLPDPEPELPKGDEKVVDAAIEAVVAEGLENVAKSLDFGNFGSDETCPECSQLMDDHDKPGICP